MDLLTCCLSYLCVSVTKSDTMTQKPDYCHIFQSLCWTFYTKAQHAQKAQKVAKHNKITLTRITKTPKSTMLQVQFMTGILLISVKQKIVILCLSSSVNLGSGPGDNYRTRVSLSRMHYFLFQLHIFSSFSNFFYSEIVFLVTLIDTMLIMQIYSWKCQRVQIDATICILCDPTSPLIVLYYHFWRCSFSVVSG